MPDTNKRDVLPIPDRPYAGLVTYDAKDPATSFPPIEPLRPPVGRPQRPGGPARRRRLRRLQRLRRPISTPTAERLAAGGLKYTRFHTTALLLPDPPGAAHRPHPPRGNQFSGEVNWVQIDLADAAEDLDHLITPEERLRVAMAKQ